MQIVKHAVIAAAGLGSRLGMGKPKCLIEVKGRAILSYQLELLREVEDVRVVVGFEEDAVVQMARGLRKDLLFVRNPAYRSTTTLQSYALGALHLSEPCLFLDGDILFDGDSFQGFLDGCRPDSPLIGVTEAKTDDAVFTQHDEDGRIIAFSRTERTRTEWANLAWLPPRFCETGTGAVYERLSTALPLPSQEIISYEVDTLNDLERAVQALSLHQ